MTKITAAIALLLISSIFPASARALDVREIVMLSKNNMPDKMIMNLVHQDRLSAPLTRNDILFLKAYGISPTLMMFLTSPEASGQGAETGDGAPPCGGASDAYLIAGDLAPPPPVIVSQPTYNIDNSAYYDYSRTYIERSGRHRRHRKGTGYYAGHHRPRPDDTQNVANPESPPGRLVPRGGGKKPAQTAQPDKSPDVSPPIRVLPRKDMAARPPKNSPYPGSMRNSRAKSRLDELFSPRNGLTP